MRWILFGIVALILILGAFLLVASLQPRPYPGYYWAPFGYGGFGFSLFGIVLLFAVVFMVIRFAFWGAMVHRGSYRRGGGVSAEEILRQRYARGEISKDQFYEMLRNLRDADNRTRMV